MDKNLAKELLQRGALHKAIAEPAPMSTGWNLVLVEHGGGRSTLTTVKDKSSPKEFRRVAAVLAEARSIGFPSAEVNLPQERDLV